MTKLLDRAIERAKSLPEDRQDEVGEIIMTIIEQDESDLRLSDDQVAEVRRRRANPSPLASDVETEEFFRKLIG